MVDAHASHAMSSGCRDAAGDALLVARAVHGLAKARAQLSLVTFTAGYVHLTASAGHRRRAWSNPIWL
jgi:hypothetical protein